LIGGTSCAEPTNYFAGTDTVPDTEDLGPKEPYADTGKFRGCTVGDPKHLRGRYLSNFSASVAAISISFSTRPTIDAERVRSRSTDDSARPATQARDDAGAASGVHGRGQISSGAMRR
jgi:hypothetical protein